MQTKLYKPDEVGKSFVPHIAQFEAEGKKAGLKPTSSDKKRTILVIVDAQQDFVFPTGSLSVPGAVEDTRRLIEWIYGNADQITSIAASLDTHTKNMIFHPMWWKNVEKNANPDPFTVITLADIVAGKWQALKDPVWSVHYVDQLEKAAKKNLMIWPYHCIDGTDGQKLVPALAEAIAWHSSARATKAEFLVKGTVPQVENYGIFAAEVPYPKDPKSLLNVTMLDMIAQYDRIYVAGEAKSHCVLETMKQMMNYFANQTEVIKKIRFMMDCTSSVAHPTIDFETLAMADLAEMEKKGVVMVKSTDPLQ